MKLLQAKTAKSKPNVTINIRVRLFLKFHLVLPMKNFGQEQVIFQTPEFKFLTVIFLLFFVPSLTIIYSECYIKIVVIE